MSTQRLKVLIIADCFCCGEVFAQPGMAERVMRLGAHAPRYPLPGPSRRELLAAIAD